ncbi:hypothetical protein HNR25_002605 [Streptomonospora salina]|uniref:Uncharacterized protein n=1 Tax=Streptomonospora salina TaxID=104205 RepID=A0A841E8P8_9ACTN|nr:hypothetical protein [Streptomonospora salina]
MEGVISGYLLFRVDAQWAPCLLTHGREYSMRG